MNCRYCGLVVHEFAFYKTGYYVIFFCLEYDMSVAYGYLYFFGILAYKFFSFGDAMFIS